jgi:hypothetical protein
MRFRFNRSLTMSDIIRFYSFRDLLMLYLWFFLINNILFIIIIGVLVLLLMGVIIIMVFIFCILVIRIWSVSDFLLHLRHNPYLFFLLFNWLSLNYGWFYFNCLCYNRLYFNWLLYFLYFRRLNMNLFYWFDIFLRYLY